MGIHCEMNLAKPLGGAFVPGDTVSGVVKYAVDKDTVFTKITVSLKGNGFLMIRDRHREKKNRMSRFGNSEDYVDIDHVVTDDKGCTLAPGAYEFQFNFKLPQKIPSSIKYYKRTVRYIVRCNIKYYIRIKFDRPGLMTFPKRFKKAITVTTGVTPRLPTTPTVYGEEKKLFQLFSRSSNIIDIKATIQNSVVVPGDKLKLNYEVQNHSNLTIKGVETNLIETYKFIPRGHIEVQFYEDIKDSDTKTASVQSGETQNMDIEVNVPCDLGSIENSAFVSRDYRVNINVIIPFPHRNATLKIPVQVGRIAGGNIGDFSEPPPSYWEVMNEEKEGEKSQAEDESDEDHDNESQTKT